MKTKQELLAEVTPKSRMLVMDLVKQAGIDTSDWANFKRGAKWAATNPKYCYEWCFVQGEHIALNLWLDNMEYKNGTLVQTHNMAKRAAMEPNQAWRRRAANMNEAFLLSYRKGLPVNVIVCSGERRDPDIPNAKASTVSKRLLDKLTWHIASYDQETGQCEIARDLEVPLVVDQFSLAENTPVPPERTLSSVASYRRSALVRSKVLLRSQGRCEWCGEFGFITSGGAYYLETHHIVSLSDNGSDDETNVTALCPNHHREAHHGRDIVGMRSKLVQRFGKLSEKP